MSKPAGKINSITPNRMKIVSLQFQRLGACLKEAIYLPYPCFLIYFPFADEMWLKTIC